MSRDKLLMPADKIPRDFIERQLQETRYISRTTGSLLRQVCRNVYFTSGNITARLRRLWGWDDVLMRLQINEYKAFNQTEWVEYRENGEIKKVERIKDWSKRDDHRHHAIDALTIACTQQKFIHRINSLSGTTEQDEITDQPLKLELGRRASRLEKYLIKHRPFDTATVQQATSQILVSFKSGKRVASKSVNRIKKGKQIIKEHKELIPRGFLHKDTVYGRIKQFEEVALSTRFDRFDDIVKPQVKELILTHLSKFDNDLKKAFNSKNLALFKEQTGFDKVLVYRHEHVVRYKLDTNFKAADIAYIVDKGVRSIVQAHLQAHGGNPKTAFIADLPVWLNQEKGIQIKSVRCFTGYADLQPLHVNDKGQPIDFVVTRNNHHMAVYRDSNGKLQDNTVTFWDAIKRKKAGIPVIVTDPSQLWDQLLNDGFDNQEILEALPQPDWQYITSLQQNEMFVLGLSQEDLDVAIRSDNRSLISKHLYRLQKMSKKTSGAVDIWFRHHLETELDDSAIARDLKKFVNVSSLGMLNSIKVKVDNLGRIKQV
jgi:CRISPR-associated endonuclease Csn1